MSIEALPICAECMFDYGQNFVILGATVYKICHDHTDEYLLIYCSNCELFHDDPDISESCALAKAVFMAADIGDGPSECSQDEEMDEMD